MAVEGKTILQTMERTELTGKEGIPFQEGTQNGHVLVEKIKEYIGSDVYICPGVFQTTEGWSTTDVESLVGDWDEFIDALKNKIIIIKVDDRLGIGNMCVASNYFPEDNIVFLKCINSYESVIYVIQKENAVLFSIEDCGNLKSCLCGKGWINVEGGQGQG